MPERRAALLIAVTLLAVCLVGLWVSWPLIRITTTLVAVPLGARLAVLAWRHARLASALRRRSVPGACHGISVRWQARPTGAVVAGLRRPEIYCHPGLTGSLTAPELVAVLLHERHHQLRRDPLRLLLLGTVTPVMRLTAAGRSWLARRTAAVEVAADRFALEHGAARRDLAGALLKVDGTASASAAAFGTATELRLRALLGEEAPLGRSDTLFGVAAALAIVAFTCAVTLAHHVVLSGGPSGCALFGC